MNKETMRAGPLRRGMDRDRAKAKPGVALRQALVRKVDSAAALFDAAKNLTEQIAIHPRARDYLIKQSRCSDLSREEWEHQVRLAGAIYLIMRQLRQRVPWEQLVDFTIVDQAFAQLKSMPNASKGTLLLTFHGVGTPPALAMFKRRCQGGFILHGGRDELFSAVNVLRDGGFVFMAPDGWQGEQKVGLNVLGAEAIGGAGAAFLAHVSRCNTAWYTFVRDSDGFVPMVEAGPTALDGETLADFSQRLYGFYAKNLETIFSGDPRNIRLVGRWAQAFAIASRSTAPGESYPKE